MTLTPTSSHTHVDAVVIGGGILGAATAYELSKAEMNVVLVERGAVNREGSGTTAGNLHIQAIHPRRPGQLTVADSTRFLPLQRAASELWNSVEDELETSLELRRTGGLMVAETEFEREALVAKHDLEVRNGISSSLLTGDDARSELPLLGETIAAAVYCADDGYANPLKVTPAYLLAAQRLGARVQPFTEVTGIVRSGAAYNVMAPGHIWSAPIVVNACGPWIADVVKLAGIALDMTPCAIQMQVSVRIDRVMDHLVEHIGEGLSVKQVLAGNVVIGGGWPAAQLDLSGRSTVSVKNMSRISL